jgi:hypothetical protein
VLGKQASQGIGPADILKWPFKHASQGPPSGPWNPGSHSQSAADAAAVTVALVLLLKGQGEHADSNSPPPPLKVSTAHGVQDTADAFSPPTPTKDVDSVRLHETVAGPDRK